jgi:DnaJ-class molecular chaperone
LRTQVPNLEDTDPIAVASESPNDVKKAYMRAARAIHPDKLTGAPLAKALTAQRVFATITAAYEALKEAQGAAL